MDVVQWFTNAPGAASALAYGQIAKSNGSEVPDVFCAIFEYPSFMATWTLNYTNSYDNDWSIQFQGDEGTLIISNEGYKVWKEPWRDLNNRTPVLSMAAPVPIETHIQNFLDCVKSRRVRTPRWRSAPARCPRLTWRTWHSSRIGACRCRRSGNCCGRSGDR